MKVYRVNSNRWCALVPTQDRRSTERAERAFYGRTRQEAIDEADAWIADPRPCGISTPEVIMTLEVVMSKLDSLSSEDHDRARELLQRLHDAVRSRGILAHPKPWEQDQGNYPR